MRIPDQLLLSIALCLSAIGIFFLALLYWQYEPELLEIDQASSTDQTIRLRGTVQNLRSFEGREHFILVSDCSVPITIFENLDLNEGSFVEVEGISTKYDGQDEFTADSITILT